MPGKLKRRLLIAAGTISTAIGIVGIFVPILPTTPFLLLAAAFYLRSSKKLYDRLLNNRFIGAYVRNYLQGKGMPRKVKIITILLLWVTITGSIIFAVQGLIIRAILLIIAIGVSVHILLIKTTKGNKENQEGMWHEE
jgi:uncharacterized membrane protein YbaN (DUF454 family)